MRKILKYKKFVAAFLLVVMASELIIPASAFALTSGPTQPEAQKFEPASTNNMVDLFSGDMQYNIPLMDVGGYPINIAYQSGAGMDDEASWVGAGWILNPGAVNRQVRGVPDDFSGDKITKEFNKKPFIRIGADLKFKPTIFGFTRNKEVGLKIGVFKDNYYGVGALVGVNAGINLTRTIAGPLSGGLGLGADLTTSSRDGVTVSPNLNLSVTSKIDDINELTLGGSIKPQYNSREGLKTIELGSSFGFSALKGTEFGQTLDASSSNIYTIGATHSPHIEMPTKTTGFTFDFDAGTIAFGPYLGFGGSGFYSKNELEQTTVQKPAYGYLHSEEGKNDLDAVMDFNREKDIPYFKGVPAIAIPVITNDNFNVSSHEGAMQFRPFRSGAGIVFDAQAENKTANNTVGVTLGAGAMIQGGGSFYRMDAKTRTEKWTAGNNFKSNGDFQGYSSSNPLGEPAYFKRVGEKLRADELYYSTVDEKARAVSVSFPGRPVASNVLLDKTRDPKVINSPINRTMRDRRGYTFSYMTAWEASRLGLDKYIRSYTGVGGLCATGTYSRHPRISIYRRPHHISEVTVTNPTGQRYVYGVPVYNVYQQETTFNVKDKKKELSASLYKTLRDEGETTIENGDNSPGNQKGRDHYFSKETTPPYATSFLLSGILSPDYLDRTGDGITDDDLGTAVKFNYTKQKHLYQWRAPFGQNMYNYNEGFLTDGKDDKANYVYGQREVWYLHSIESKTMVAIFELQSRQDGWGVEGMNGGIHTSPEHGLKRLHKIKLYSKAEIQKAGGTINATPIKVVNFEYEYTAWPNVENNPNPGQGKLTLKKIWFTFGKNNRGESFPYVFSYQGGAGYDKRAVDRWGMYKPRALNPAYTDPALSGTPTLNNSEWPYAVQDQTMANNNAGAWQLNEVELPSGGKIKITYESDDYAFVQNRPAMQMFTLNGLGTTGNNTNLINEDEILVNLPEGAASTSEFKEKYLRGMKYLYYKFHVQLTNDPKLFEYVPGYAEIDVDACERVSQNVGRIRLKMIGGKNPMSKNTWQFLRLSLPQIAYPGYDNSELTGSDFRKLIKSLKDAIQNLGELTTPFDERAEDNDFANTVKLDRSWVRLYTPDGYKLGGGSRVQKIEISDEWQIMSDQATATAGIYGQRFEYKIASQGETGQPIEISSGVASYEPLLGGDENPFRQPITYRESVKMGLDNYYYMEEPLCESYYPAPSVGYSRVKVTSFGKETPTGAASENVGYAISEFFTARDFPVIVEQVPNDPKFVKPKFVLKILGADVTDRVVISQGYKVELNDMHGKPKKEQIYNKSGSLVSMMEYFYKTENPDAEFKRLLSTVSTVNYKGEVDHDAVLGMDIEMYTDMRQQYTKNEGRYIGAYGGAVPGGIIPLPFAKVSLAINKQVTSYNSASTIKVVQQYGILQSVRKTENGSTLSTENVLWDEETGEVLLTKTQNEYDDPIYNFTYPAHWAYSGMGPAYKNADLVIFNFSTHSTITGKIDQHASLFHAGDEVSTSLGLFRYWVTEEANGNKYLIDAAGNLGTVTNQSIKVYRPGRRNMPSAAMGTVVMLQNPVEGNQLVINQGKHILDVANTIFKDEWAVPVNQRVGIEPKPFECPNTEFMEYFVKASMAYRYSFGRRGLFSMERDDKTVAELISAIYPELIDFDAPPNTNFLATNLNDFLYDEPAAAYGFFFNTLHRTFSTSGFRFRYSLQNNDQGRFGDGTITINCVDPVFNDIVNSNLSAAQMKAYVDTAFCLRGTCTESTNSYVYELVQKGLPDDGPCGNQGGGGTSISLPEPGINGPEFCSGKVILRFTIVVPRPMVEVCQDPVNQQINPYFMGIKGNWQPHQQYSYLVNRASLASTTIPGSTDIRRSGYFNQFTNFWQYNPAPMDVFTPNTTDDKWVKSMESTGFNRKSQEIENINALNLFNTAYFGFIETLPTAIGANVRYRDIAYDGFEDYGFKSSCVELRCPPIGHFDFRQQTLSGSVYCNSVGCVTTAKAHSGKYSLEVKNALTMTRAVTSQDAATGIEQAIVNRHADGRYILIGNELAKGFAPTPGARYIMSFWVHEGANPLYANVDMSLQINGGGNILNGLKWPVVEDWKRVWVDFTLPANSTSFSFTMTPGAATTYVDDIRIFPYNGQVKSFAYDERSLRLMAEMDENNFATFYEYDDEGMLIRVKKETERGIMTLKENRSSLRKKPQ